MPEPEQSFTVREASAECGVSPHTLRYYERAGLLDAVPRTTGGRRRYGPEQVRAVRFIARLRGTGMPIAEIKRYADLVRAGPHTEHERLDLLIAHRAQVKRALAQQQQHLTAIDRKIALYRAQSNN